MNKSYIYSETAFHHEGNINYLKKLIDMSNDTGVNGVKFQVLTNINDFVSQKHNTFEKLKKFCLTKEQWKEVFQYTKAKNLDIILMPLNKEACSLANEFEIKFFEIHSVSFNDNDLIEEINKYDVDVSIGVGGRELQEIYQLNRKLEGKLKALIVGFQSFPSKIKDVKLKRIQVLKEVFPEMKIGYADHSSFDDNHAILSNDYARLLGAEIFEKHITLNEGTRQTDYESAIGQEKMKLIVERLKFIDNVILNNENLFVIENKEQIYRQRQLVCVASKDLKVKHTIKEEDVLLKMSTDIDKAFNQRELIVGKYLLHEILKDETFKPKHIYKLKDNYR